jgi:hypothetical protein
MSYREFGNRDSFALGGDGTVAHVHVAGIHLTEFDDKPYWPAFLTALRATRQRISECLNFLKYEQQLRGLSAEEAHRAVLDTNSSLSHLHSELRFANWGPTTDGHVCFLLPIYGSMYVSCSALGEKSIASSKLRPYDIADAIGCFLDEAAQPFAAADGFAAR